ncbi:MAG: M20/M25/M40 family metallo-hydrolase [Thermoanaerobaculia bacterium]|nr:M20/M25/M40 family metallo-hydrolase [Thermoanaerobaculia bacterium]
MARAQLQDATVVSAGGRARPAVARVVNVLGRLVGRERGRALLLLTHYDSVPNSPGASDDGSGVAAVLETLRALRSGPQLRNDVIFLFTDGEEAGLLGARAFAEQHPWIDDVGAVVNFEARGTRGPSLMFETSDGNARLIGELRRAMGHPRATSYSYEIYKLLPNDTDFSVFRRRGLPGMNFAFIHGATAYHTAQDSFENLDPRSLQHHGEAALGLARGLGEADLRQLVTGTRFTSTSWARGSSLIPPAGCGRSRGWRCWRPSPWSCVGRRRGRLQVGKLLLAVLAQLLVAVLFGGLGAGLSGLLFSFYNFSSWGGATSYSLTLLGLALAVIALTIVVGRWLIRKLGTENLTAAGLIVWLILTLAIAKLARGPTTSSSGRCCWERSRLWWPGRAASASRGWRGRRSVRWRCTP